MANGAVKRKSPARAMDDGRERKIAAGEFKARCLGVMKEVASTGRPVLVTRRGKPLVEVVPPRHKKSRPRESFIGRLVGLGEIVGDPDDLINPVFPLEDYDMLK